jgi:hypothetical protein
LPINFTTKLTTKANIINSIWSLCKKLIKQSNDMFDNLKTSIEWINEFD